MTEFFYIDRDGQQQGPVTSERLRQLVEQGAIPRDTSVWQPGMADWVPLSSLPGILPPHPPPGTPTSRRRRWAEEDTQASSRNPLLLGLVAGGGLLLVVIIAVAAFSFRGGGTGANGTNAGFGVSTAPTQLVGNWTGRVVPDFSRAPALAQAAPPNALQGLQFEFRCAPDGKVRWGMGGIVVPVDFHPGLVRQQLLQLNPNTRAILTEFATTADSCCFTIHEAQERDVEWGGPGTDLVVTNARKSAARVTVQRVGEEVEVELRVSEDTGGAGLVESPVSLRGRLQRN